MSTKELAYKILDNMNEEQLKGFVALFASYNISVEGDDLSEKEKAYNDLRKMIKPIPDIDYDKEIAEYRDGKY